MLSIIVPVYNSLPDVMKLLKSLVLTTDWNQTELIMVDDASPEFVLSDVIGPPAKIIRNEKNSGFAYSCDIGACQAQGDVLLFLNSDIQAQANWYKPVQEMFVANNVGVIGPKLLFPNSNTIQSCGGLFDGLKGPYHRYLGWSAEDWRVNQCEQVKWTTGAAFFIRKDDFYAINGFDPAYIRGYFEDVDACMKVRMSLHKEIWYCPDSVFIHSVGASTKTKTDKEAMEAANIFKHNSLLFHERWDSYIEPDTGMVLVGY